MRKLLLFLLIGSISASCRPQKLKLESAASNNTLLWEVSGKKLKKPFYIFGTMHLMCSEDARLSPNLKTIVKNCDTIFFELDMDDLAGMVNGMGAMRMRNGVKLKDLVTADEYTRIKKFFTENGSLPFSMVENFKPMLLASTVMQDEMSCANQSGMEMAIMEENTEGGKKEIKGLETMAEQAGIFDSIPYKEQVKELLKMMDSTNQTSTGLKELVDAYKQQNLKKIEEMTLKSEPGLLDYMDLLLYKRNRNWVVQMKQMAGGKLLLFAVGAGHLVGKAGVLELLRKEGYTLKPLKN